jgi:LPXTG-motif cell wall-anchored protein
MRRRAILALTAVAVSTLALAVSTPATRALAAPRAEPDKLATQPPSLPGDPTCGPSQASPNEPPTGRNDTGTRYAAPIYFAHDFPLFADTDPNTTLGAVGGFGGIRFRGPLHHTPIIFVHGNQVDAQNWLDVMLQFQQQAGYTMQEMYALSFNGLENWYAGEPEQMQPSALDQLYLEQNDNSAQNDNALANGGHGAGDDDNVPDLCHFIEAVQWYTGSRQVDIVAHSLGVTITRRLMELYPSLAKDVVAFVGIAGGNHGTSVCTGLATSYYGCDEIAPGTQWLADLNAYGETYGPTKWMTVYNGAEGDPFFIGPSLEQSPALAGADNEQFNANTTGAPDGHGDYHNDLRVDPPEVDTYLSFLLREGQAGPGAAHGVDALAASIAAAGQAWKATNQQAPSVYQAVTGTLCIPDLTGTQDGCDLPSGTVGLGPPGSTGGIAGAGARPAVSNLPNTGAATPAAGPTAAGAAATLAVLLAGALRRRRRVVA